ncbi:hypothetical protein N5U05_02875 [Aliarcobacter butzleri]|uniref:hypothetical protein n=1 Tax=Aliarcobacter butzleri TaxID=28197 RepID=UPI0021B4321C|nr:hypothetical protein [Aliarcobacter butzleri]MCT7616673.1 hypothetical protein [Aliarcobacter butzleri]
MKNMLKTRKEQIVNNVGGEDELKKLQKVKLLKLMELEIQQMIEFWSLGQVLEILNSELGFKISKTVFYEFCAKNLKKDEKSEPIKKDKKINVGVSQRANEDTKKSENLVKNIDDLTESTLDFLSKNLPKK